MVPYHKLTLTAGLALAMALTFSCSGDDGGGDNHGTGTPSSSDNGGSSSSGVSSSGGSSSSVSSSSGSSSSGGGSSSSDNACVESWQVTTPATCEVAGVETETCTGVTRAIPQLEYDPVKYECTGGKIYLTGGLTDSRDDATYKAVLIGGQVWMAENLNYDVPGNATDVCYQNNDDNCVTYGRLYNWATAMGGSASSTANPSGVQGVCPAGWHLPSDAEWDALLTAVGGSSTAGTKLKADSPLWNSNGKGTDEFGFSALPGGSGYSGSFGNVGDNGYWWSSTVDGASYAYYRNMSHSYAGVLRGNYDKTILFSVRCAQD